MGQHGLLSQAEDLGLIPAQLQLHCILRVHSSGSRSPLQQRANTTQANSTLPSIGCLIPAQLLKYRWCHPLTSLLYDHKCSLVFWLFVVREIHFKKSYHSNTPMKCCTQPIISTVLPENKLSLQKSSKTLVHFKVKRKCGFGFQYRFKPQQ